MSVKAIAVLGKIRISQRTFDGIERDVSTIAQLEPAEAEALAAELIQSAYEARTYLVEVRQKRIDELRKEIELKLQDLSRLEAEEAQTTQQQET